MGDGKCTLLRSGNDPVLLPIGICCPGGWELGYMLKQRILRLLD